MYLIHGKIMPSSDISNVLTSLQTRLHTTLTTRFDVDNVLACTERFAQSLLQDTQQLDIDSASRAALHTFCRRDALTAKLERELGTTPFSLRRIAYNQSHFESWRPLGIVVHITPSNAPLLAFFAMLESLLVGNINWLRPSSSDDGLTIRLLAAFLTHDESGKLADYLAVLPLPSHDLGRLFKLADAVSAWGGHAALNAIRQQLPAGCRWIDWGHRISFSYLTPDTANMAQSLDALVDEVCRLDQQACSSPQCVLVDSQDSTVLHAIGAQLAAAFARRAQHWPALVPSEQEAAEISCSIAFARLDQSFSEVPGHVWHGNGWRIIWAHTTELAASPLFRTVQLRPMPRTQLITALQPWRTQLQTCGLIATAHDTTELTHLLLAAGVSRVTPAGAMHDNYDGEPHDGVYALARLSKRVTVSLAQDILPRHVTLDPPAPAPPNLARWPIMDKATFQNNGVTPHAQLFFRSGGSSGSPKLAGFSYRDYHRQMQGAADGLFTAGIDPANDRVMNLLYGSNLYGGLMSFFTILDKLSTTHFPMGGPATNDYSEIAHLIVEQKINTLIGMPSTIHQLFVQHEAPLRAYGGIHKILTGGESLSDGQRQLLTRCGVSLIRSAIYGSVDAGPLGHACAATPDGTFHLIADTQWLEIIDLEHDRPAAHDTTGRLIFTSRAREGQSVMRYDLGDLGRWVHDPCPCGLPTPRFALCGRHGQLVRIGTIFFNPIQLAQQIDMPVQFLIDHATNGRDRLHLHVAGDPIPVRKHIQQQYILNEALECDLLELHIINTPASQFIQHQQSGKTPLVLDKRQASSEILAI